MKSIIVELVNGPRLIYKPTDKIGVVQIDGELVIYVQAENLLPGQEIEIGFDNDFAVQATIQTIETLVINACKTQE